MEIVPHNPRTSEEIDKISAKVSEVMSKVTYVYKDGKNTFQRYTYVSEAGVASAVRAAMIEVGIIASPSIVNIESIPIGTTKNGTPQFMTNVAIEYMLIDIVSQQFITSIITGSGTDSGDKGVYKAITGANKYFLLKTFQLETGDDAEKGSNVDKGELTPLNNGHQPFEYRMNSMSSMKCQHCGIDMPIGTDIVKTLEGKVMHTTCFYYPQDQTNSVQD